LHIVGPSTSRDEPCGSDAETLPVEAASEPNEPVDEREDIKLKFLVEMPEDFYDFWEFAKTVNAKAPSGQFNFAIQTKCLVTD